ncbi:hypothetical protein [Dechloromonas sp. CZR5]|uniref:hypothetical protein n=1 Tax=Dechloromonas sp. CZR5 TaxID=2608630 RepID=UPI00123E0C4E|nr:hypothetical protein [Dechloromonas sp. CZR5]
MSWFKLPEPRADLTLAFHDLPSAKAWLAAQPQAQPMHILNVIGEQINALEASTLAPGLAVELLNLLRSAAVPGQDTIEARFIRKALPMAVEDERAFELAQKLWLNLGIAYLRLAPHFPPDRKCLPLHRAACAFRMAQYCYFQAARQCPPLIGHLLFAVLDQAESSGVLRQALPDPDFRHLGESNIGGHLAWAFMLHLIDPYRLSAAQLAVANRAISRWRELTVFQMTPDDDPKAHSVDLAPIFGPSLPPGVPRWMEVRKVERKIEQRIVALQTGESPESLKLGRELSGNACIRLLRDLESSLESTIRTPSTEIGEIELAFGAEHAFSILTGESLNPSGSLEADGASLAHQRVALFGFDRASTLPSTVKKLHVPSEKWTLVDGKAIRAQDAEGARRLAPCLVAAVRAERPCLGVLYSLQSLASGALSAELSWFPEPIEAGRLVRSSAQERTLALTPAFLMHDGERYSLLVPANATVRLNIGLGFQSSAGTPPSHLLPTEVLERGIDFVRYAVNWQ